MGGVGLGPTATAAHFLKMSATTTFKALSVFVGTILSFLVVAGATIGTMVISGIVLGRGPRTPSIALKPAAGSTGTPLGTWGLWGAP